MGTLPRQQRVAAYALIVRDEQVLLCRLSERISPEERWTLPGGGVEHGEHPRNAVLREIAEETGLLALVSDTARLYSAHLPGAWRAGTRVDAHALRIVYDGWVAPDAPPPQVVEVDGSTAEAAWKPLSGVLDGSVPVVPLVEEALADHRPFQMQRVAAYALIRREGAVLLTRISPVGYHTGAWTLPGGGIDHGEPPAEALAREVMEECGVGCEVGGLLDVHDLHFSGTAPSGRHEDYHGIHLIFAATVAGDAEPRVVEVGGTTDAVAWVPLDDIAHGRVEVTDVVHAALSAGGS
ncbi:MAG: NUDIX domain-containing protein [Nocardioidaceae bacterium]